MAASQHDRNAKDGDESCGVGSNVSGARRITHEIDTDYGTGRTPSAVFSRPSVEGLEPRPSHVPTLPAPMLTSPPRPARTKSATRRAIAAWEFEAEGAPSWLGSHVEGLIETLNDAPSVAESALSDEELVAIAIEALGGLHRVPRVALADRAVSGLKLSRREAFVLSLVDGISTVENIVDMSAMPELEALGVLIELCRREILSWA